MTKVTIVAEIENALKTSPKTDINENIEQEMAKKSKEPDDLSEESTSSSSICDASDVQSDEESENDFSDREEDDIGSDHSENESEEDSFDDADEKTNEELEVAIENTQKEVVTADLSKLNVVDEVNTDIFAFRNVNNLIYHFAFRISKRKR